MNFAARHPFRLLPLLLLASAFAAPYHDLTPVATPAQKTGTVQGRKAAAEGLSTHVRLAVACVRNKDLEISFSLENFTGESLELKLDQVSCHRVTGRNVPLPAHIYASKEIEAQLLVKGGVKGLLGAIQGNKGKDGKRADWARDPLAVLDFSDATYVKAELVPAGAMVVRKFWAEVKDEAADELPFGVGEKFLIGFTFGTNQIRFTFVPEK
ncbi:MAG: hypothetical protein J0L75_18085 [Spirochaetes bacterium]|nr:hypothetical protein [Spirochaetota bacterium]